jgi:hypothetical protein
LDRERLAATGGVRDVDRSPRAPLRRPPALLDFASASASVLPDAGRFPGGLLVTTTIGRS